MVRPQKSKCIRLFLVIVSLICHILGWFDFFRPSCRLDIRYKIGHWSELVTKRFRVRIPCKKSIIFQGLNKLYFYLQNILVNNSKKPLKSLKWKKNPRWDLNPRQQNPIDHRTQTKLQIENGNLFNGKWFKTVRNHFWGEFFVL